MYISASFRFLSFFLTKKMYIRYAKTESYFTALLYREILNHKYLIEKLIEIHFCTFNIVEISYWKINDWNMKFDLFCFKKELFRFSSTPPKPELMRFSRETWTHPIGRYTRVPCRRQIQLNVGHHRQPSVGVSSWNRLRFSTVHYGTKVRVTFNLKRFSKILLTKARKIENRIGPPRLDTCSFNRKFLIELKAKKKSRE